MAYNIGSFFVKSYDKITASKWTKLFVLMSIMQLFTIVVLEINILIRNVGFRKVLQPIQSSGRDLLNYNCELKPSVDRLQLIAQENVIFMLFQLFQLWFCINAIYNENTIQMITITVINFSCTFYGIIQIFEIKKWLSDLAAACNGEKFSLKSDYLSHDLPLVMFLMAFASIMAFICWELYLEYGWIIYKRVGADIIMQKIFRTRLIFIMLLKLSLFFVLICAIDVCLSFSVDKDDTDLVEFTYTIPKNLYYFHLAVTALILILVNLGYQSAKREWKLGMIIYLISSTITIIDFALIFNSILRNADSSWYFFITFIAVAIFVSFMTWIWGIFVYLNFDKGLLLTNANESILEKRRTDELCQLAPGRVIIED